jgi:hypothetical protein
LALAGCGDSSTGSSDAGTSAGRESLIDLAGVEPLRQQFERDAGKSRLLVLLSPT